MVFQVISVEIFEGGQQRKNLKGRIRLSDGTSQIIVMLSDKSYNALTETKGALEKWSIWTLNVGKQTIQVVKNT